MRQFEQLLRDRIGLDPASIGTAMIQRAVRLRLKALGFKTIEAYAEVLAGSETEWNELVESIVITETWFFRDAEPFRAFRQLVRDQWLPANPARRLRVLSVPCSSGEEPYSLAMALLDEGLGRDRFEIDAADLSARSLAKAQRGIYGKNSFRGKDLEFRDRYFATTKEGFALSPAVRAAVNFHVGNLLDPSFFQTSSGYDFVFCRNLLIYFDRPTQKRALACLERLLSASGYLFVGTAEQPLAMECGFVSANLPMAFACRKAATAAAAVPHKRPVQRLMLPAPPPTLIRQIADRPQAVPSLLPEVPTNPVGRASHGRAADLDAARRLADAGQLAEAAALCEAHLEEHGTSAQAFYLLGLVKDAANDASASEFYRKALYLDPNHYECLVQMSLLAQKTGDVPRARALRRRAQRVKTTMS